MVSRFLSLRVIPSGEVNWAAEGMYDLTRFLRSGAVEQLRVHVRNLGKLDVGGPAKRGGVELYERGYGKDAAGIAKEAINYGAFRFQIPRGWC